MWRNRWLFVFGSLVLLALAIYLLLSNQHQTVSISVEHAWARPAQFHQTMPGDHSSSMSQSDSINSAIYMIIRNNGEVKDRLIAIESDIAKNAELHQTLQKGEILQMQPLDALEIPARSQVILSPGGYHIMLIGLARELKVGDRFNVTLVFEKNGRIPITVEIRQP
jgi:copper(I)-binding protein